MGAVCLGEAIGRKAQMSPDNHFTLSSDPSDGSERPTPQASRETTPSPPDGSIIFPPGSIHLGGLWGGSSTPSEIGSAAESSKRRPAKRGAISVELSKLIALTLHYPSGFLWNSCVSALSWLCALVGQSWMVLPQSWKCGVPFFPQYSPAVRRENPARSAPSAVSDCPGLSAITCPPRGET
jgi:hypothetical protein